MISSFCSQIPLIFWTSFRGQVNPDANPLAVAVVKPGGNSLAFTIAANIREALPDIAADATLAQSGDLNLAEVSIILQPVGPGSSVTTSCTRSVNGTGSDAILSISCPFYNVPVNNYAVVITVSGSYYQGSAEEVITIYDPSLGYTTGGGIFLWPGTDEKTNFGFTIKYNRKGSTVQGSLVLIRHLPDGSVYRMKTNALYGLSMGTFVENNETYGWASFSGKGTYLEPGWPEPLGNYEFIAYIEDRNEPGSGMDRFWIRVKDKDGNWISTMSMLEPAKDNAIPISGGNILTPHSPAKR